MSKFREFSKEIREKKLLSVTIGLLNECPSRCVYCRKYTFPKDRIDIHALYRTIGYLYKQGVQTIVFSGGEPLMYPYIVEVLEYCKTLGIQTSIITTLIPTKYLEKAALLCTRIHTSVDSANKELYHQLRGVDALDIVEKNITFVNSIRKEHNLIPVRISSVISNKSYDGTRELYEFAKRTGSTLNYYFVHTRQEYYLSKEQLESLYRDLNYCALQDEAYHISNARSVIAEGSQSEVKCNSVVCRFPYITCEISPDGLIYPCCNLYDENADYNSTRGNAYGTIYAEDLEKEFNKRFDIEYGLGKYCKSCVNHLLKYIDEINDIYNNNKLKLFI